MLRIGQRIELVRAVEGTFMYAGASRTDVCAAGVRGWVAGIDGRKYRLKLDHRAASPVVAQRDLRPITIERVEGVVEDIDYHQWAVTGDESFKPSWDLGPYEGRRIRITVEVLS